MTRNERLAAVLSQTGWTNSEVARRVNDRAHAEGHAQVATSTGRVGRWLDGEQPRPPVPRIIATVTSEKLGYQITPADLGFTGTAADDPLGVPWVSATVLDSLITYTGSDLMLSRRELTQLAAGAPLLYVAQRFLGDPPHRSGPPTPGPGRVGLTEVAAIERLIEHFRALDSAHGGNLFRRAAVGQLKGIAELLREGQDRQVTRRLYAAAADLAQLVGWMSHDARLFGTAQRYWAYGLAAAKEATEPGRGAEIISRMAHQQMFLGHPERAVSLLEVAENAARHDGSMRLRAMLTAQHGRMLAGLGDEVGALERLDRARDELAAAGTTQEPVPPWIAYFTLAELAGAAAVSHRDLRDLHGRQVAPASVHFADAVALRDPGYERCTAMDLVGLAAAHLDEGEPEAACTVAGQAIDLASHLDSSLISARVQSFVLAASGHGATREVMALRDRARSMVGAGVLPA